MQQPELNSGSSSVARNSTRDRLELVGVLVDGRYLIEAEVGRGGFGVVYRARHLRFDSTVALKVLFRDPDGLVPSQRPGGRGSEEGRLLFQLSALHPSFVRVFETGLVAQEGNHALPYLAMEWLDGLTLKRYIDHLIEKNKRVPLRHALHLLDDLAQALAIAHERRVAHRDIKPANVFLALQGGKLLPKLVDFGLAKVGSSIEDAYDDSLLRSSPFTPAYAAPEQWDRSLGATGPWTDVYSFALVLVELLCGRRWYPQDEQPGFARLALDPQLRPTPRRLGINFNDGIESVLLRALAVAPRSRYVSINEFWSSLCAAAQWRRPSTVLEPRHIGLTPQGLPSGQGQSTFRTTFRTTIRTALSSAVNLALEGALKSKKSSAQGSPPGESAPRPLRSQARRAALWLTPILLLILGYRLVGFRASNSARAGVQPEPLTAHRAPLRLRPDVVMSPQPTSSVAAVREVSPEHPSPAVDAPTPPRTSVNSKPFVRARAEELRAKSRPAVVAPDRQTDLPSQDVPPESPQLKGRLQPKDYLLDESLSTRQ